MGNNCLVIIDYVIGVGI